MKVFVSHMTNGDSHSSHHTKLFLEKLRDLGFTPMTVGTSLPALETPFSEVVSLMKQCDCAIVLGFAKYRASAVATLDSRTEDSHQLQLSSEWNHIEAAVALMLRKPVLMMRQKSVSQLGMFAPGAANLFVHEFRSLGTSWIDLAVPKLEELRRRVLANIPPPKN